MLIDNDNRKPFLNLPVIQDQKKQGQHIRLLSS